MHLDPPLSSAIAVRVSSAFLPGSRLCMYATLSLDEYATLCRDGTKVQVWSDFGTGEWSAASFEKEDVVDEADTKATVVDFSLIETTPKISADTVKLVAMTPLLPLLGRTFQFTYRMLHSSGAVSWLGSVGTNGSITVEATHEAGLKVEDWREDAPGVFLWNGSGENGPQVVTSLCRNADWRGWAIGKEGPSSFAAVSSAVKERVALALLPTARPGAYIAHTPVLYYTTGNATLSLTSSGEILFHSGEGNSVLHASTATQTWRNAISDKATTFDTYSPSFLGVSVQHDAHVGRVHVLPISGTAGYVTLASTDFSSLTSPTDTLALIDPATRFAKFFVTSSLESIHVSVGPAGGEILVLPGYTLHTAGGEWNVACLPHGTGYITTVSLDTSPSVQSQETSSSSDDLTSESTVTSEWLEPKTTAKAAPTTHPTDFVEIQILLLMLCVLRFFLRLVTLSLFVSSPKFSRSPTGKQIPPVLADVHMHKVTTGTNTGALVPQAIPRITFIIYGNFSVIMKGDEASSKLVLSVDGRPLPTPIDMGGVWLVESDVGDDAQLLEVTLHE